MNSEHHAAIQAFMDRVAERNPNEPEFLQAVEEVAEAIVPFMEDNPKYKDANILERIVEPERVIMFRVPWTDDAGNVHTNRGSASNSTAPLVLTKADCASTPL